MNSVPAGRSFIIGRKQAKRQIKQYIGSSKKAIPLIFFLGLKSCKRGKIDRPPWGLNLITLACHPATLSTIEYLLLHSVHCTIVTRFSQAFPHVCHRRADRVVFYDNLATNTQPTDYLLVITTTYIHPISYILHSYTHTYTYTPVTDRLPITQARDELTKSPPPLSRYTLTIHNIHTYPYQASS